MSISVQITIAGESRWKFETYWSAGISIGVGAGAGGGITLRAPSGHLQDFYHGGVGAGLSVGPKLPKGVKPPAWMKKILIRLKGKSGSLGPTSFPSGGLLYITSEFTGSELAASDIRGLCAFAELGAGLVVGGSATAMLLNLNPLFLPLVMVTPMASLVFLSSAKAVLLMAGANAGIQANVGITSYLGYLH